MAAEKFSQEERLEIGRRIYEGELNRYKAAARYGISEYTARSYLRMYKASLDEAADGTDAAYVNMSKSQLIDELMKTRKELDALKNVSVK